MASLVLLGLSGTSLVAQDVDAVRGTVKVVDVDLSRRLATVKLGKELMALRLSEDTIIRVDKVMSARQRAELERLDPKVWCFAKLDHYQKPDRTVGALKPRLVLALGYGIEPLPKGRRNVRGVIGLLSWLEASVEDWQAPGTASCASGLFDLGLNVKEPILRGTRGTLGQVKKGKRFHLDGERSEERLAVATSGKLLDEETLAKTPEKRRRMVPLVEATRIVFPHRAFKSLYRYMWIETYER
jgi:hypothetical protein